MNNFIIYSLEIAVGIALFYSVYWAFLKNETFFKLNRFYLLASVMIALLMPLLNISVVTTAGEGSFIARYLVLPVEHYEQSITSTAGIKKMPVRNKKISHAGLINGAGRETENLDHAGSAGLMDPPATPTNSNEEIDPGKKINWLTVVMVIYFTGAALFFIRFIANLIRIFSYALKYRSQQISGMKVIKLEKNSPPFSFLNFIFISADEYPEAELNRIISHEKIHIGQRHSIDLILLELLLVFQWFNPFVWLYKRAIKITHEYLADYGTLDSGIDMPGYQYSLLNQALSENNIDMASTYNLSVKKRIDMMVKKRSSKLSALKLAVVLPLLVFLFSAFACKSSSSENDTDQKSNERNKLIVKADTPIRKVDVPAEYLKQLEGVYRSTDEPRVRKIRFTSVIGTLVGNDNGYVYTLIPVGDGKFINPDDSASLVFDTKNKDAITLLLFGTVHLNKVKPSQEATDFPKLSVAFSLADVIEKAGIPAALSHYKEIRSSANYDLNEGEMNLLGYLLLKAGQAKEAAAIFKLNTEAFPNSFNVYDSYGEALLILGDKTHAIENYRRSVQINPGSKNGIKVLKELNVNTDSLAIKEVKVPVEFLNLLEGEYVSTNQPDRVRKITFMEQEGLLAGYDNGYRYKLIPLGNGKFINPDDGASLVFDTEDKNAITLLLFGKINLKKVSSIKKTSVSHDYLKLLEGNYVSTNENGVRKIKFAEEKGVLTGNDNGYHYQLVPLGNGKFINPDDGAPFAFDTKNKNAITLLLFGKVNLKKVN